ncbi:FtsX-like permease family protein [Acidobacteriota bacterium]
MDFLIKARDAVKGLLFYVGVPAVALVIALAAVAVIVLLIHLVLQDRRTLALACRNVFRNKRRTRLTLLIAATGVVSLIIFGGYTQSSYDGMREATIRSGIGHLQLYKKGFNEKGAVDKTKYVIDNYEEITDLIASDPVLSKHVLKVGAELNFSGIVSSEDASTVCIGRGVQPEQDALLSASDIIIKGEMFSADAMEDAVIGSGLASSIGADLGDYLTILVARRGGSLNAVDIHVSGIMQGAAKEYDDTIIKMPLSLSWQLMGMNSVSKIVILLDETENTDMIAKRWEELIAQKDLDLEYRTWSDLAIFYHSVKRIFDGIFFFVKLIIAIIVIFAIGNTLTMSVMERVQETGTLRAMGCTKLHVMKTFLAEGVVLGLLGGILGVIAGLAIAEIINLMGGVHMSAPPGQTHDVDVLILSRNFPILWLESIALTVLTAFLSSIFPARRASKMDVAEALRHY